MSVKRLTESEIAAVNKRAAERYAKKVEFERLRKYAPASILDAAANLEPTHEKRASATEKPMSKRRFNVSFVNVLKGEDVQDFEFTPSGLKKAPVPATGRLDSPKPTDASRPAEYPADSFLAPNPDGELTPIIPGGGADMPVSGAGTMPRDLNLMLPSEDEAGEPGMFSPANPGPIRMGNTYVGNFRESAKENLQTVFKRRGSLFADLLLGKEE